MASKGRKKQVKKETGLGLTFKKDESFGEWYSEVVVSSEMIEYYDISGCYILRPWSYGYLGKLTELKKMKVKNSYFPLSVSSAVLQKEKDHIEGFAPEGLFASLQESLLKNGHIGAVAIEQSNKCTFG